MNRDVSFSFSSFDSARTCWKKHRLSPKSRRIILVTFLHVSFGIYLGLATYHYIQSDSDDTNTSNSTENYCHGIQWCDGYGMLLLLTATTYFGIFYYQFFKPSFGAMCHQMFVQPVKRILAEIRKHVVLRTIVMCLIFVGFFTYIYVNVNGSVEQTQSVLGIVIFYVIGYVFSTDRKKIQWRPVMCGVSFQFLIGILCIHLETGRSALKCIGSKVTAFLYSATGGSSFVYGDLLVKTHLVFAFFVLPVIYFFDFAVSILYYWNVMQWVVRTAGWVLEVFVGTTACESVVAAGNTFLGMTESLLLIRPYLQYLTASELHAVMTSSFASVSGATLIAYISHGVEAPHLITSSVMSAPASLAFSKLFHPETDESLTRFKDIVMPKSKDTSTLDAACSGAFSAISVVLGIIANLIAFISCVALLNSVLGWLGYLIGLDFLSFEWIISKLFFPVAFTLGIPYEECDTIAQLIALKTVVNEFVAYERLGSLKKNKTISLRSSAIVTFAMCGFANPGSLGVLMGAMNSMCPEIRPITVKVSIRAFIAGCIVCLINASVAGLFTAVDGASRSNSIKSSVTQNSSWSGIPR